MAKNEQLKKLAKKPQKGNNGTNAQGSEKTHQDAPENGQEAEKGALFLQATEQMRKLIDLGTEENGLDIFTVISGIDNEGDMSDAIGVCCNQKRLAEMLVEAAAQNDLIRKAIKQASMLLSIRALAERLSHE